ncbi:MAG: hypothetical protein M0R22_04425 [Dehalococcoidia bacterium]|nr:hypothetical protein [Dehalococcoidia bacterium]
MTGFKLIALGYVASGSMALFGQIPEVATAFGPWVQYGALGLLGIAVLGQLYIIIINQRDFAARMDGWEKLRHEDSATTNETLSRLRENCAKTTPKG